MRTALAILLGLAVAAPLSGCKKKSGDTQSEPATKPVEDPAVAAAAATAAADKSFLAVADAYYKRYLERHPGSASQLGYHEYDGKLDDRSPAATAAAVKDLRQSIASFATMTGLSKEREYDRQVVLAHLRDRLFKLDVLKERSRNPMSYPWALSVTRYISRDYAPVAQRAQAIVKTCEAAGPFYQQAQNNLDDVLAKPMVQTALLQANGTISFLQKDVVPALTGLGDEDKAKLTAALDKCVTAMAGYRDFLLERQKKATDDFAIGKDAFLEMLADGQGLTIELDRLESIGKADLERNLASLKAAADKIAPGKAIKDAVAIVAADKPAPDKVLAEATAQSAEMRAFLIDNKIVTIPSDHKAEVRESPPFMRWNFAFLDSPGPFETKKLPSFYYISPPDPKWPKKVQNDYIASRSDLLFVTIHEVWPGHFLHGLHKRKSKSKFAKSFCAYSMSEGWAHYTEEMMWDAGVGKGDPKVHVGQLQNALLRNVRYISAIGLHTKGMTVEQSKKLFLDKGMQDEGNAMQQAVRGTFDPGYLNYTLGKLMIRKLHHDWKNKQGDKYTIAGFHDEFLRYQCAPVPVIRTMMLGENAGPAL